VADRIVPTQTSVFGVELIYLEDQDVAGIHIRGLARLLDCNPWSVHQAKKNVSLDHVREVEMQTARGMQEVSFILEEGVIQILESIMDGKYKRETKSAAKTLYRRYARAGFKLYTMLQVAPKKLKQKKEIDQELFSDVFADPDNFVDMMFAGIVNEVTVSSQSRDFEKIKQNLEKEHQSALALLQQVQKVACMADVLRKALMFNELVQHASFAEIVQSEILKLQELATVAEQNTSRLLKSDLSKTSKLYVLPDSDQHDKYRMP
jgi:anti-sigma28 factor (negative regulator of flagellin synthesis)